MSLSDFKFQNTYSKLPEEFFERNYPASVESPTLIKWNHELAQFLGLDINSKDQSVALALAEVFSGNKTIKSSVPISTAYSGHQFGHFSPILGDGRAHLLGELKGKDGLLYDVQLKGSGRSAFSRSGDGRSPLGPVVREYIMSEAMHHLGVPTTRSLTAVTTGEKVYRENPLEGGVLTRVAHSLVRVGTFEYFASRGDKENLKILLEYLVQRVYPEIKEADDLPLEFFKVLAKKQIRLVAKWMSLGFIHGVMNTDNTSAAGLTIDYGPCAFLDETNFDKVFSSIDRQGRYAYKSQPQILRWNLTRLAEALLFLYEEGVQKEKVALFTKELEDFAKIYEIEWKELMFEKLGLSKNTSLQKEEILNLWLNYLNENRIDFTLGFRNLSLLLDKETKETSQSDFYKTNDTFLKFKGLWIKEIEREFSDPKKAIDFLNLKNPLHIPRNHMVEKAISAAYENDFSVMNEMIHVQESPFAKQSGKEEYSSCPKEEERVRATFCGT